MGLRPEEEQVEWGLGHMVERGCSGQAAGEVPGVCELAGVQREESCKQLKVPGLCSCLFGTFVGPTCSADGHNPLLGAGNRKVWQPHPSRQKARSKLAQGLPRKGSLLHCVAPGADDRAGLAFLLKRWPLGD